MSEEKSTMTLGEAIKAMRSESSRSIILLPPVLQAVWTAAYAATVQGVHAGLQSDERLNDGKPAAMAERDAWEAVRRANGGEMPEEPSERGERSAMREALLWYADEDNLDGNPRGVSKAREALGLPTDKSDGRLMPLAEALTHGAAIDANIGKPTDEEKQLAVLKEAIEQPCPVTGEPFFMVLKHPDLGWVPTYGGPYDSYTAPEKDEDGELSHWHYDHDAGQWTEEESMCLRVVDSDAELPEPTDEEMVEALAPIVARLSHGANLWEQNKPFRDSWIEQARQCLAGIESTWTGEFRQHCAIALASWKAARAWGRK